MKTRILTFVTLSTLVVALVGVMFNHYYLPKPQISSGQPQQQFDFALEYIDSGTFEQEADGIVYWISPAGIQIPTVQPGDFGKGVNHHRWITSAGGGVYLTAECNKNQLKLQWQYLRMSDYSRFNCTQPITSDKLKDWIKKLIDDLDRIQHDPDISTIIRTRLDWYLSQLP